MSGQEPPGSSTPPAAPPSLTMQNTPNAERYVLEADAMRRRQLRSALLHGSARNWRDHARTWPAVVVGLIVVAVIVAGLAVSAALQKTEKNQEEEQRQQQRGAPAVHLPVEAVTRPASQVSAVSDPDNL